MNLQENLIKIWKSKGQIVEGIKNNIFKKDDVEHIAQQRINICHGCKLYDFSGEGCMIPGTHPCCNEKLGGCGCSLKLKTRALSSECPKGKWIAELTEEEEDLLNEKLGL